MTVSSFGVNSDPAVAITKTIVPAQYGGVSTSANGYNWGANSPDATPPATLIANTNNGTHTNVIAVFG